LKSLDEEVSSDEDDDVDTLADSPGRPNLKARLAQQVKIDTQKIAIITEALNRGVEITGNE
jgi:hypothetical protein